MHTYEQIAREFTDDDTPEARIAMIIAVCEADAAAAEIAELSAERDAWLQDQRYMQSDIERGEY